MQLTNYAAVIPAPKAQLEVREVPCPECKDHELVIVNEAIAINPVDWKIQQYGLFDLPYPFILGCDVAGVVFDVGPKVKGFKQGDRVMAQTLALGRKDPARGAFQLCSLVDEVTVSHIPSWWKFEEAVVLPLSISTAAAGMYLKANLGLDYPSSHSKLDDGREENNKHAKSLLLWGGSSSVGSSVIQFATASGYKVVTTASPANFDYCKSLGAVAVLDYHDPKIVDLLIAELKHTNCSGAYDAIGTEAVVKQCASVLSAMGGGTVASVGSSLKDVAKNVRSVTLFAGQIVSQEPEVAKMVWGEYIPKATTEGKFVARPKQLVIGKGLEMVQKALDVQRSGVSARKVVVRL